MYNKVCPQVDAWRQYNNIQTKFLQCCAEIGPDDAGAVVKDFELFLFTSNLHTLEGVRIPDTRLVIGSDEELLILYTISATSPHVRILAQFPSSGQQSIIVQGALIQEVVDSDSKYLGLWVLEREKLELERLAKCSSNNVSSSVHPGNDDTTTSDIIEKVKTEN